VLDENITGGGGGGGGIFDLGLVIVLMLASVIITGGGGGGGGIFDFDLILFIFASVIITGGGGGGGGIFEETTVSEIEFLLVIVSVGTGIIIDWGGEGRVKLNLLLLFFIPFTVKRFGNNGDEGVLEGYDSSTVEFSSRSIILFIKYNTLIHFNRNNLLRFWVLIIKQIIIKLNLIKLRIIINYNNLIKNILIFN